jgi:3',5'-cyclic AMP phosphodiesterase CpdA
MFKRIVALVTFFFATQWIQAADKLVGGPFVVNVSKWSATVVWIVQTADVKLGESPYTASQTAPVLRSQKVKFADLEPGKTYYYDVLGRDEGKGHFKTVPVGPAEFKFVVYGDTRTRHDMHQRVMEAVSKAEPDFVLHTGDLVASGRDSAHWLIFFSIEKDVLRKTVFFPSLGNHERNDSQYHDFFDVRSPYYSFNWGTSHFVVLNSDIGNAALSTGAKEAFWAEQRSWLEDDLKKSQKAAFRFLTFHHPPFTAMKRRQSRKHPIQEMVPLFEQYNVTAVFNGHDHNYQHHVKNGVHYVVTGGGGAPLYEVDAPIPEITQKVVRVEHFVQVKVAGEQARIEAVGLDGRLIDTIELTP